MSVYLHKTIHFTAFCAQDELPGPSGVSGQISSSTQVQPSQAVGGEMVAMSTESLVQICIPTTTTVTSSASSFFFIIVPSFLHFH